MIKSFIVTYILLLSVQSFAAERQMIDTLGSSKKGQFVAIEEYGYKPHSHTYYATIKVMNIWKKIYVGKKVEVEIPADQPNFLTKARSEARVLAKDYLKKFGISG